LALAVLALLFERPMHPYEMGVILRQRHKEDSIKLRYGSLYTVIELLLRRGFITARETGRDGRRPERTVYEITPAGRDELHVWMTDLIAEPVKEYPQFEAALCLLPVLPPEEALALLRRRLTRIEASRAQVPALPARAPEIAAAVRDRVRVPAGADDGRAAFHRRRGRAPRERLGSARPMEQLASGPQGDPGKTLSRMGRRADELKIQSTAPTMLEHRRGLELKTITRGALASSPQAQPTRAISARTVPPRLGDGAHP
jgi:DNA-binding PadR family transcriptional regulator